MENNTGKENASVKSNVDSSNKKGDLPQDKFVADTKSQSGKSEYKGNAEDSKNSTNPAAKQPADEQKKANAENFSAKNDMAGNTQGQVTNGENGRTIGAATKNDRNGLQSDQEKR